VTGFTIGEVARRAGVNSETLRYYERQRLVAKPPRTAANYRRYPEDTVRQVRFIKRAQELGFSLSEIKELLAIRIDPQSDCADVRQLVKGKLAAIEQKIRTLHAMRKILSKLDTACPGRGPSSACPILDSFEPDGEAR